MTNQPDFRALCAELEKECFWLYAEMSATQDFNDTYEKRMDESRDRARAALDAPVLAQPDFRALLVRARQKFCDYEMDTEDSAPYEHRALMAEIDAALNTPPLAPIPVAERLPGAEDLHTEEGWCWFLTPKGSWQSLYPPEELPGSYFSPTHWLPYWAIPLPEESE